MQSADFFSIVNFKDSQPKQAQATQSPKETPRDRAVLLPVINQKY
jgi:hypothetical protein